MIPSLRCSPQYQCCVRLKQFSTVNGGDESSQLWHGLGCRQTGGIGSRRFDLIYLVLDKAEEATDRKLARHLLSLHYERGQNAAQVRFTSLCVPAVSEHQRPRLLATWFRHRHRHESIMDELADHNMAGCRHLSPLTSCVTS